MTPGAHCFVRPIVATKLRPSFPSLNGGESQETVCGNIPEKFKALYVCELGSGFWSK